MEKILFVDKHKSNHPHLLVQLASTAHQQEFYFTSELFFFLLQYSFLFKDNDKTQKNCTLKTKHFLVSQGNGENGARYLDPKYSRWLSTDPALGEYTSGSDAGCGGIYNHVNLSLYHYGGNNPIRYVDPDGREDISSISMNFKKSTQTLTVTVNIVNPEVWTEKQKFSMPYKFTGNEKKTFTIKLTNNVKTPEQRGNIPVKFRNYYYFPEDFPNGTWNVTDWGFNDKNLDIG